MTKLDLMIFADDCNCVAGFECVSECDRKGRMKFLRQYEAQRGECYICGSWYPPAQLTRDHVVPRSRDGGSDWDNIKLACKRCNEKKGDAING